jgi:Predicted soluble lytic transglycosylase fused to an ABC-type amino acid-binding protein
MESELPQYENLIRQVAHEFNIDWALLAAIAYQESHWNPKAKSYTGVRGMMMLTQRTAKELDVIDRLNPLQSLRGGARYLNQLRRRLAPEVAEPDRTYLAMAAYNVGMGHLNDARILAAEEGGDPNAWEDVMQQLPKLQKTGLLSQGALWLRSGQRGRNLRPKTSAIIVIF